MDFETIITLLLVGVAAGMLGGFIGVGGGIIIVPAMVFFMGMSQYEAQGTSLAMMLPPIGVLAVWNYWKADAVNMKFGMILAVAFVLGGFIGSKLALRIDPLKIKLVFGLFMIFVAIKMTTSAWNQLNQ